MCVVAIAYKAVTDGGQVIPGESVSRFFHGHVQVWKIRQFLKISHRLLVIAASSAGIVCLGEIRRQSLRIRIIFKLLAKHG